jgi:hypothetical protein
MKRFVRLHIVEPPGAVTYIDVAKIETVIITIGDPAVIAMDSGTKLAVRGDVAFLTDKLKPALKYRVMDWLVRLVGLWR